MENNLLKLQSAMEYLMTYGWAILIIAVVLGALFGLGFFNSANLAPKVGPGACQVYRPNGPGTTSFINLEGSCNNELPQYVGKFNGVTSNVLLGTASPLVFQPPITIAAWVYGTNNIGTNQEIVGDWESPGQKGYAIFWSDSAQNLNFLAGSSGDSVPNAGQYNNAWHFFIGTANTIGTSFYVDGQSIKSVAVAPGAVNTIENWEIGACGNCNAPNNPFVGYLADIQVYNTSLTPSEVVALYDEGVGGVPLLPQKLVGWWPLNGNANDYSGNLNNGVSTNVIFTSSWTSGYTAP